MNSKDERNHIGIPLFDGTNYNNWVFRLETLLDERSLLKYIKEDLGSILESLTEGADKEKARMDEKKCKTAIVRSTHDSQLETIKDKKTAKEMIDALKAIFERKSVAGQLLLRKQLLTLRFIESGTMSDHFMVFERMIRDLKSAGANIEEMYIVCHLLLTMPKSFDNLVTALETMEHDKLTVEFVKSRLMDEANKKKPGNSKVNEATAMNAKVVCHFCLKEGHYKSQCRKLKMQTKSKNSSHSKQNTNFKNYEKANANQAEIETSDDSLLCAFEMENAEIDKTSNDAHCVYSERSENQREIDKNKQIKFILDSGATEHMVNNKRLFASLENIDMINISVAKKQEVLKANHREDIAIKTFYKNDCSTKVLKNVLFVQNLNCNLMSIRSLTKKGFKIVFEGDRAHITLNGKTIFVAELSGKLYEVVLYTANDEYAGFVGGQINKDLWHHRLAHLNVADMKRMFEREMVRGIEKLKIDNASEICESCIFGKQSRLPFPRKNEPRSNRILELIHTDVCGPLKQPAYDGSMYFVTFTDDFSRATKVYCIKYKSDACEKFVDYVAMCEALHGHKIARLRADNGGEYISGEFKRFCKQKGIQIEYTTPYNPEMNSIAERVNRTLEEKARAMIISSEMDRKFWNEAILSAAYIKNRSPTSAIGEQFQTKTPAEIWHGHKPDISGFRIFGSICYNHIPRERRDKLDAKSEKCIMLGYASSHSYRLWNIDKNKLIIGRNVTFNENSVLKRRQVEDVLNSGAESDDDMTENPLKMPITHSVNRDDTGDINKKVHSTNLDGVGDNENNIHGINGTDIGNNNINGSIGDGTGNISNITHGGAWNRAEEMNEPALRRSGRQRNEPDRYGEWGQYALSAEGYVDSNPQTISEAKQKDDWPQWKVAIQSEYDSLINNGTWNLVELPKGRKPIACKWVFKLKRKADGTIDKYKARLVAKGYSQQQGFDYNETYAPVAKLTTLRVILSIANHTNMLIHQMDVKCAFLNGNLSEEIYMQQPEEFKIDGRVCKLIKAIYGLKQASQMWYERFNAFMISIGFQKCSSDQCLYIRIDGDIKCYVLLYVDDLLIVCENIQTIKMIKQSMSIEFEMTDVGEMDTFLGIHVKRDIHRGQINMNQSTYMKNVLQKFGMSECKNTATPIEVGLDLAKCDQNTVCDAPYRELIGCLTYATMTTRPDLCASTNYFSRFQSCFSDEHYNYARRILRYVRGTTELKLVYNKHEDADVLLGYTDSDWANDKNDRKSVSGYVFKVFGNTVSWGSRKQATVSLSSTEAEYVALAQGICEAKWLRSLLEELGFAINQPVIIFEDNQSCIKVAEEPRAHKRMKHIDVKYHFIREAIGNGEVFTTQIQTKQ